jgi:hypothetical protein
LGRLLHVHNQVNDLAFNPIISEARRIPGVSRPSQAQGEM